MGVNQVVFARDRENLLGNIADTLLSSTLSNLSLKEITITHSFENKNYKCELICGDLGFSVESEETLYGLNLDYSFIRSEEDMLRPLEKIDVSTFSCTVFFDEIGVESIHCEAFIKYPERKGTDSIAGEISCASKRIFNLLSTIEKQTKDDDDAPYDKIIPRYIATQGRLKSVRLVKDFIFAGDEDDEQLLLQPELKKEVLVDFVQNQLVQLYDYSFSNQENDVRRIVYDIEFNTSDNFNTDKLYGFVASRWISDLTELRSSYSVRKNPLAIDKFLKALSFKDYNFYVSQLDTAMHSSHKKNSAKLYLEFKLAKFNNPIDYDTYLATFKKNLYVLIEKNYSLAQNTPGINFRICSLLDFTKKFRCRTLCQDYFFTFNYQEKNDLMNFYRKIMMLGSLEKLSFGRKHIVNPRTRIVRKSVVGCCKPKKEGVLIPETLIQQSHYKLAQALLMSSSENSIVSLEVQNDQLSIPQVQLSSIESMRKLV